MSSFLNIFIFVSTWLTIHWTYCMVAILAIILGIAEILSTFTTYPFKALFTRWAFLLLFVNTAASLITLALIQPYFPSSNPLLSIVAVGFGFQTIIRTKFTIAKPFGPHSTNDVNLNVSWIYEQFQNLCRTQIDLQLMSDRKGNVGKLVRAFSYQELHRIAYLTIRLRKTLSISEEEKILGELDTVFPASGDRRRLDLALLAFKILEYGGQPYVDFLIIEQEDNRNNQANQELSKDQLIEKLLSSFTLEQLRSMAKDILSLKSNDSNWVDEDARDTNSKVTEIDRKRYIATRLIDEVGLDFVEKRFLETKK